MIVFTNVTKAYGKRLALCGVSLKIEPGEFVCVTGPSGAGKTTMLSLLIGAEVPTEGVVEIDNIDLRMVPKPALQLYRRRVGMIFQDYKLLKNRTVAENIAFPLEVCGVADDVIAKRVTELLADMKLTDHADSLPDELSGGEQARVAIARAIAHKPLILLADEPSGNLDPEQAKMVLKLLKDIHAEGTTVILATHDAKMVDTLKTRVIGLSDGKVARDSTGGYEEKPEHAEVKHDVFSDQDIKPTPREIPESVEAAPKKQKKVRITSIHSE